MGKLENLHHLPTLPLQEVIDKAGIQLSEGLPDDEAGRRRKAYGPNRLQQKQQKPIWQMLLDQFTSSVMYLLAAAALLSFIFGDIPEGIAIATVMLINAGIGFGMEYQARQSMKALKEMDKITARVVRNGAEQEVDAEAVVPGDVVLLETGFLVPADLRLAEVAELQVNEAPLTGESVPIEKTTEALQENVQTADQTNMAFKGTSVTRGKGKGIVIATGMDTEIGNISEMVSSAEEEEIPLNRRLGELSRKLIYLVLGLAALLALTGWLAQREAYPIIQTSIAWAIAAIPEGLPIVASIALARGMLRLAHHQVIVKRLASVETLGETNTIFSDKTGTLTKNQLTVNTLTLGLGQPGKVHWRDRTVQLEAIDPQQATFKKLLSVAVLANNAEYDPQRDAGEGDPLEIALLRFAEYLDPEQRQALLAKPRIAEDPFDRESYRMGAVHQWEDEYFVSGKGAAEAILDICTQKLSEGRVSPLSDEEKNQVRKQNEEMANDGLRPLAFAYRIDARQPEGLDNQAFLHDMVFVGLIGFVDPPAEEVPEAVDTCREAGIEVVMVTGDHPGTALNIARQVRLLPEGENRVMHGRDLNEKALTHSDLTATQVFARVNPEQKLKLIGHFQKQNKIVGMTGDGVNDAPALKKADIGIAMGRRGAQVAKEVADMVLKDDAFPSIVKAIREGRIIFSNIRKFIVYQLSYHLSEILVIALVMAVRFELALLPLQLLYLNILLDVFPALALGVGRGRKEIMKAPPKDPEESIITNLHWVAIVVYGVIIGAAVSGVYFYGYFQMNLSVLACNNVAFFTLAFSQLLNVLNMRDSGENIFINQITKNRYVWMAIALCAVALLAAYSVPGLNTLLSLQDMEPQVWRLIAIGCLIPAVLVQLAKQIVKR